MTRTKSVIACRRNFEENGLKSSSSGKVLDGMLNSRTYEIIFEKILEKVPDERKSKFGFVDSLIFNQYCHGLSEKVPKWIKKLDLLSKQYILVPIVMWSHWRLVIMCNFDKDLEAFDEQCILILDSLLSMEQSLESKIRSFVLDLLKIEGRCASKEIVRHIPIMIPKVPQQTNGEECGFFVLYYAQEFIQHAPQVFSLSKGYPYFMKHDWFNYDTLDRFRHSFDDLDDVEHSENSEKDKQEEDMDETNIVQLENDLEEKKDELHMLEQQIEVDFSQFEEGKTVNRTEIEEHAWVDNVLCNGLTQVDGNDEGKALVVGEEVDLKGKRKAFESKGIGNEVFFGLEHSENMEIEDGSDNDMFVCSDDDFWGQNEEIDGNDDGFEKFPRHVYERDGLNPAFEIGMTFDTKFKFKQAIVNHGINTGRKLYFKKDDKERVRVACKGENCEFLIYSHKVHGTYSFQIRKMNLKHDCSRSLDHTLATAKLIASRYLEDFRSDNLVKIHAFQEKVHKELIVNISDWKTYKIRHEARKMLEGEYKDQYKLLWNYCEELRVSNPNSSVSMKSFLDEETGKEYFRRIYVCLDALRKGFMAGCRKILGLDGTFLKGPHKGVLLTAVGVDPNNGMYPIAYAVAEAENGDTWEWFIEGLIDDLSIYKQDEWTLISDRQKGLIQAVGKLLPRVEHRFCVRHLHNNIRKCYPGDAIKNHLWNIAKTTYQNQFEAEMESLKAFDEGAFNWLKEHTSPKHWCRAFFRENCKCDLLLNNHSECFNRQILSARTKPILGMLEKIKLYLMLRQESRRKWICRQKGNICPRIMRILDKIKNSSAYCFPSYAGDHKFQVREVNGQQFAIDTAMKVCSCRKWQLSGIPCKHGVAALGLQGSRPEDYIAHCYTIEAYKKAYEPIICPTNGANNWPKSTNTSLLAPENIRLPGRPKTKRRLEEGEKIYTTIGSVQKMRRIGFNNNKCKKCGQNGHNRRTCPSQAQISPNATTTSHSGLISDPKVQESTSTIEISKSKEIKSRKCSVCGIYGHNKATCTKQNERGSS